MKQQGYNVLVCSECDLHFYINPKPVNAIILENEKNEILFVIRKIEPKQGMLDLPGGFVDVDETFEESMKREVKEEINIDLQSVSYVTSFSDEYEHGGLSARTICALFHEELPSDTEIVPGDDAAGYQWIKKFEIPFERLAFEGMREALKTYVKR